MNGALFKIPLRKTDPIARIHCGAFEKTIEKSARAPHHNTILNYISLESSTPQPMPAADQSEVPSMRSRSSLVSVLCSVIFAACLPSWSATGQDRSAARAAYLRSIDLEDQAANLEEWLLAGLAPVRPGWPSERLRAVSSYFAFVLALSGVTADDLSRLRSEEIDPIHAITADTRPFIEQAMFADLVVVGTVAGVERQKESNDGFDSSALIDVAWVLKGLAPSDTIAVRQHANLRERDIRPEIGETYLLLLSNGMYRFNAANERGDIAARPDDDGRFLVYRIYRLVDGRLEWEGLSAAETELAFQEIRRLDHVLNMHRSAPPPGSRP